MEEFEATKWVQFWIGMAVAAFWLDGKSVGLGCFILAVAMGFKVC